MCQSTSKKRKTQPPSKKYQDTLANGLHFKKHLGLLCSGQCIIKIQLNPWTYRVALWVKEDLPKPTELSKPQPWGRIKGAEQHQDTVSSLKSSPTGPCLGSQPQASQAQITATTSAQPQTCAAALQGSIPTQTGRGEHPIKTLKPPAQPSSQFSIVCHHPPSGPLLLVLVYT